ncbi:MAG: hypothetical protein HY744_33220 [Deltaproteobacteria bacterium]|nr:hypothetical protein [Deltaproteobacteria bacterium]
MAPPHATRAAAALLFGCALGALALPAQGRAYALRLTVEGARPKFSLKDTVRLTGRASWSGPRAKLRYLWSSEARPPLPAGADPSAATLVFPREQLVPGASYRLRLDVIAEFNNPDGEPPEQTAQATSEVFFQINTPPRGGGCTLQAKPVGDGQAAVRVEAPGWTDEEQIQYRYVLLRNAAVALMQNWSLRGALVEVVPARPGDRLQAKCQVRDKLGDGAEALSRELARPE